MFRLDFLNFFGCDAQWEIHFILGPSSHNTSITETVLFPTLWGMLILSILFHPVSFHSSLYFIFKYAARDPLNGLQVRSLKLIWTLSRMPVNSR